METSEFDHNLNWSRRASGHRGLRMPPERSIHSSLREEH